MVKYIINDKLLILNLLIEPILYILLKNLSCPFCNGLSYGFYGIISILLAFSIFEGVSLTPRPPIRNITFWYIIITTLATGNTMLRRLLPQLRSSCLESPPKRLCSLTGSSNSKGNLARGHC